MRLYLSLLWATIVLFDYVNASSARLDLTMVTAITPNHHNVPPQRFLRDGAKTNEEERGGFGSLASNLLYWKLMATGKPVEEAFTSFKLHDNQLRALRFDAWAKYAAKAPTPVSVGVIKQVQKTYGPGGLAKMLKAFIRAKGTENVVRDLKYKLIDSWKAENTPMKEAFTHLRLNKPTDPLLRERLLNTWVEYGNTKEDVIKEMVEAIDSCGDEIRVAILEGLGKLKGTDGVVKFALNHLMTHLKERKVDANFALKLLKLNQPGDNQLRALRFDAWAKYAAKAPTPVSVGVIKKVQKTYGPGGLVSMLKAFITAKGTENVVRDLKYKLIDSWKAANTPMKEALSHLRLDKPTDPLLCERLLNTWVEYGNTKEGMTKEMVEAIDSCGDKMRVAILEGLRKLKGTDGVVKFALNHLMTHLKERKVDANFVFKLLKLDQRDTKPPRTLYFDAWVKYAESSSTLLSESTLESVFDIRGDVGILKLIEAYSHRIEDLSNLRNFDTS